MNTRLRMQHDINGVSISFSDKMDAEFPGWRVENTDLTRLVHGVFDWQRSEMPKHERRIMR